MLYSLTESEIKNRIDRRDVKIGFIGLGRIGLPLAATLADKGFGILGVDIKSDIVNQINAGINPYVDESGLTKLISEVVRKNSLKATNKISETKDCDVLIISVPTLVENGEPQIEAVKVVANQLARNFLPGKTVVLQSTVPPFTTKNILQKAIEDETGLKAGQDFGLAYSPERTQSPQVLQDLRNYPKVVGTIDAKSALIISKIYGAFAPSIIDMGSLVAAELEKLVENTYRDVNIAFANELAQVCELYGVDVYGITKAANSQPYSHILNPGLVGGHCIPVVPYFIISEAKKNGFTPQLMQTARDINESVFEKVVSMMDNSVKRVTVLGLSFKKDVRSFETSHTLKLVGLLKKKGYDVVVHDPFLDGVRPTTFDTDLDLYRSIEGTDCIVLSTDHSTYKELDLNRVKKMMRGDLIIDVRGLFDPDEVKSSGLRYKGIGRIF